MVLGKLPVLGRPTIWITVGQGPTALAVGAGGGCLDIFSLIYPFFPLSPSLWETARYRLKYCLKGPLNPKSTNQPTKQMGLERKLSAYIAFVLIAFVLYTILYVCIIYIYDLRFYVSLIVHVFSKYQAAEGMLMISYAVEPFTVRTAMSAGQRPVH